jgi:hypothetical protein
MPCYVVSTFAVGNTLLTNATIVWDGNVADYFDEQMDVPIGFGFGFYGCVDPDLNSMVRLSTNGYLSFYQQAGQGAGDGIDPTNDPIPSGINPDGYAGPWWDNLSVVNQSSCVDRVSYKTEGAPGNRVFTAEWRSVSREGGTANDFRTFQVKLFEADFSIEFHYGNFNEDTNENATVGLEAFNGGEGVCGPNCGNMNAVKPPNNYRFNLPPAGGACCFPFEFCNIQPNEADCLTAGGLYQGDGTTCAGGCPGIGIDVVKTADVSTLCQGVATPVTYTYTLTNTGDLDLGIFFVDDDVCGMATFVSGDTDMDGELDLTETWTYECTDTISSTTMNTVMVDAHWVNEPQWITSDSDTLTINADPPPPCMITGPLDVCETDTGIVYQSAGAAAYAWSIVGDGVITGPTDQQNVTIDPTGDGSYTLTVVICTTSPRASSPVRRRCATVTPSRTPTSSTTSPGRTCGRSSAAAGRSSGPTTARA